MVICWRSRWAFIAGLHRKSWFYKSSILYKCGYVHDSKDSGLHCTLEIGTLVFFNSRVQSRKCRLVMSRYDLGSIHGQLRRCWRWVQGLRLIVAVGLRSADLEMSLRRLRSSKRCNPPLRALELDKGTVTGTLYREHGAAPSAAPFHLCQIQSSSQVSFFTNVRPLIPKTVPVGEYGMAWSPCG